LALEEKQIPYRVEKINMRCYGEKPDSFQRLQPSGAIPVAIINGVTYRQSNDIIFALDNDPAFHQYKSLLPYTNEQERAKTNAYLKLERQLFSAWMGWLTRGDGSGSNKAFFLETLQEVEQVLQSSSGPFFMGNQITQVDVLYAPFLERMAASLLYYKGFTMRLAPTTTTTTTTTTTKYPALNQWFDAMEQLPSYQLTKSDYYTHCWDLPPQLGGCTSEPAGRVYEAAINGEDATSWTLPLAPHNGGVEPDWDWAGDEASAQREAVERLSANHDAIVRFAARGAGSNNMGKSTFWAPLSDPLARPNEAIQPGVDHVLRIVCMVLLQGGVNHDDDQQEHQQQRQNVMMDIAKIVSEQGGKEYVTALVASLSYLRDRVGVPRDMKLPAARQLRAHLNWAITALLKNAA
jgi:glutathione S-transferase